MKKAWKKVAGSVLVITVVCAAVLLLRSFVIPPPTPVALDDAALLEAVRTIMPNAAGLLGMPDGTTAISGHGDTEGDPDRNGATIGFAVDTSAMEGLAEGYAGRVPVVVVVDSKGKIAGTAPLKNAETPSYIERIKARGLFGAFNGMTPAEALAFEGVNAVSGATFSSNAVISASKAGFKSFVSAEKQRSAAAVKRSPGWFAGNAAALLVLITGLAAWIRPSKFRKFRKIQMTLDVVVLGFIQGTMLSLALFAAWISGGPDLTGRPVAVAILALSALLPLITGRHLWCTWLCPFGAALELAASIPAPRQKTGPSFRRAAGLVGIVYVAFIAAVFIVWPETDLAAFEPFAAFSLTAAPLSSLVIAGIFIVISAFAPRFWCRFLCPTGRIMDFLSLAHRTRPRGHESDPECRHRI